MRVSIDLGLSSNYQLLKHDIKSQSTKWSTSRSTIAYNMRQERLYYDVCDIGEAFSHIRSCDEFVPVLIQYS